MAIENQQQVQKILEQEKKITALKREITRLQTEKQDFIQLAIHELKTPLRKINTFADLFVEERGESLNDEEISYISRIKKNISLMQSLLDDLVGLTTIDEKREAELCDLNLLLKEVLDQMSPMIKEKRAIIHISDLPVLEANASQMREVFKCLLDNSIKFQPLGQFPEITVISNDLTNDEKIIYQLPSEIIYYKIKFADNGIGIDEENREQVFNPFVKLNGKSAFPGNGLGLAVCKKIIELHHGIIYLSERNSGGCINIILPQLANNDNPEEN